MKKKKLKKRIKKLELELEKKDLEIERLSRGPTNRIYRDLLSSKCSDCKYCKEDCYALVGECIAFNKFVPKEEPNDN